MKAGELAVALGISRETLYTWIRRPEVANFLSLGATGKEGAPQKMFSEADVLVFTTVAHLRYAKNILDWAEIADYLNSGKRHQDFPQHAIAADSRTVPLQQAEVSVKAMATMTERDNALAKIKELETLIEKIQAEHRNEIARLEGRLQAEQEGRRSDVERLMREVAELNRQIGRLERDKGE